MIEFVDSTPVTAVKITEDYHRLQEATTFQPGDPYGYRPTIQDLLDGGLERHFKPGRLPSSLPTALSLIHALAAYAEALTIKVAEHEGMTFTEWTTGIVHDETATKSSQLFVIERFADNRIDQRPEDDPEWLDRRAKRHEGQPATSPEPRQAPDRRVFLGSRYPGGHVPKSTVQ